MNIFLLITFAIAFLFTVLCFLAKNSNDDLAKLFPHMLVASFIVLLMRILTAIFSHFISSILIMVTALTGVIYYWQTNDQSLKNKFMASFFAFIVFAGTSSIAYNSFLAESHETDSYNDELFYAEASGFVLGDYLGSTFPNSQILIIVDDKDNPSKYIKSGLDGLIKGLNLHEKVKIISIDSPDILPEDTVDSSKDGKKKFSSYPERKLFYLQRSKAENFDKIIYRYPECNMIISLIGLPSNPEEMSLWQIDNAKRPKIALLRASPKKYGEAVYMNAIVALVAAKGENKTKRKEKKFRKAFDDRFVLLTPQNIEQIYQKNPELFQ